MPQAEAATIAPPDGGNEPIRSGPGRNQPAACDRFDRDFADVTPHAFRDAILANGAVVLRNAVPRPTLARTDKAIGDMLDAYAHVPPEEFDAHLASDDPEEQDIWSQIKISHVFERTFKQKTLLSFFDIVRDAELWKLASLAFLEATPKESKTTNSRRMQPGSAGFGWDAPLHFHVDAQFFYHDKLSINFWTPLVPCGVDAPGLQVVELGVAETRDYLRYSRKGHPPKPHDIAFMRHFDCTRTELAALEANGLSRRIWAPDLQAGDVLAFTNFTMHATYLTPEMTRSRTSVEVRIDLPGFRPDWFPPEVEPKRTLARRVKYRVKKLLLP